MPIKIIIATLVAGCCCAARQPSTNYVRATPLAETMRYVQFAPDGNRTLIGALDGAPIGKELTRESDGIGKRLKFQPEMSDPIGN